MSTISIVTKNITLEPKCLTSNIKEYILNELNKKYKKVCCDDYGLIISIGEIIKIDNLINKDSIGITFTVSFKAETIKPEIEMEILFTPFRIIDTGIFGKIYEKINFYIPIENVKEFGFEFNESENIFENEKESTKISLDTEIKVCIQQIKYDTLKYNCICKLICFY